MIDFLCNPFVLVQGPPGTGKSVTGCLMSDILLKNTENSKILLITFTNHALDQTCLELIKRGHKELVRLGGNSKSVELQT